MIERPNWSIVDYLELLVSIEGLPEAERQAAIEEFFETHPTANVGIRAHLSDENYPTRRPPARTLCASAIERTPKDCASG